jgi:4-hydroxy-tetrahydrodipicolinate reductase
MSVTKSVRVFQVATGNVGTEMIKRIATHPELELIGLHCYTTAKSAATPARSRDWHRTA